MSLPGVLVFRPTPHHDERGFFTRTFDAAIAAEHGVAAETFGQDSQSRSRRGTIRGMHGRSGQGEAKLVRCARGAIFDVVVDIRPESPAFGRHLAIVLDDIAHEHLFIPPGFLHGFQALTEESDVCYRIDRPHDPAEDISVRFDDAGLGIEWPMAPTVVSARDRAAGSWEAFVRTLAHDPARTL